MKRLTWIWVLVLLVGVLGTGGYAVAQVRRPDPTYRTATATRANLERTLDLSGTVAATGRRDLGFATAGKVSKVAVRAGQRVRKGQVLARLDATALEADVTSAESTLARARAQLASDEDAQSSAVSDAPTGGAQKPRGATKPPGTSTPAKPDPALQQALAEVASGQQAVTAAETAASAAIAAAKAALADQEQKCRAPDDGPGSGDADGTDPGGPAPACTAALQAVQDAQDVVADKQDQLQAALGSLSATLTKAVSSLTRSSQSQGAARVPASTLSPSSPSSSEGDNGAANGAGGGTVTAARLAQDQADIDTAKAQLGVTRAARELATLRAPYAGRILRADLERGDQTSSADTPFVLRGHGVTTVTTKVSSTQVRDVRRGQSVTVTPAGWRSPMRGSVTSIGMLPDSSGDFAVTVTVESSRTVSEGSTAAVSIVTGVARDAVTVPTSALVRTGDQTMVRTLSGSTLTRRVVTVGVVGARRASITRGLTVGTTVVLADLSAKVPSSTTRDGFRNGPGGGDFREGPRVEVKQG